MKTVSIIVPIYKVEKYLKECLDSILRQTYTDLQIILIDDGSPDGCGAICDEYALQDNRIVVIHSQNGGLSAARNKGLAICEGEHVLFVDSDDYLEENAVEVLLQTARADDLDILLYDAISFDEENKLSDDDTEINKYIRKHPYPFVCTGPELFMAMLNNDEYRSPVQYYFYKKSFLDEHDLRFHEGILHEDQEFNFFALLNAQRVKHMPNVLYHHRFRSDSIMGMRFTLKNTHSWYKIISAVIERDESFMSNSLTANAFLAGLLWMVKNYYAYVRLSSDGDSEETLAETKMLRLSLKKVHYFRNNDIKVAVLNCQKRNRIKSVKMKIYPYISSLLRKK